MLCNLSHCFLFEVLESVVVPFGSTHILAYMGKASKHGHESLVEVVGVCGFILQQAHEPIHSWVPIICSPPFFCLVVVYIGHVANFHMTTFFFPLQFWGVFATLAKHPQEDLAIFGYRICMKNEILLGDIWQFVFYNFGKKNCPKKNHWYPIEWPEALCKCVHGWWIIQIVQSISVHPKGSNPRGSQVSLVGWPFVIFNGEIKKLIFQKIISILEVFQSR